MMGILTSGLHIEGHLLFLMFGLKATVQAKGLGLSPRSGLISDLNPSA